MQIADGAQDHDIDTGTPGANSLTNHKSSHGHRPLAFAARRCIQLLAKSTISPTASHQYLSGILDRLMFRPKSLAAQKFDRGEYEKSAEGSKTATSARLGLLPSKTAQPPSAFSSSKYDRSDRVAADAIGYGPFVAATICTDAIPDVAVRATALSGKVSPFDLLLLCRVSYFKSCLCLIIPSSLSIYIPHSHAGFCQ